MGIGLLIQALRALGMEASLVDLRDILWLAGHINFDAAGAKAATTPGPAVALGGPVQLAEATGAARAVAAERRIEAPVRAGEQAALYGASSGGGGAQARRVQLRGVPALPQALALGRALRPLSRRRPGRTVVLDERATAEFIAETRVRAPVWRPARERWFDIVLAVEDVPSLAAWQPLVSAFERLLLRQGGFRSVMRLLLRQHAGQVLASTPSGRPVGTRALVDRHARRIVLVLSDCTSAAWRRGAMGEWLQTVAADAPLALVQLLPQALWPNTATGFAELRVGSPRFGLPSAKLRVLRPSWAEGEPGLVLPVLPLEPAAVAAWARMVVAAGSAWAGAALLPLPDGDEAVQAEAGDEGEAETLRLPVARAAAFRASATADAQRLAAYFSVVRPLTPPVMRVIHQAMAPASGVAALAQVFLGGLLLPVGSALAGAAADEREYEFHAGLRDLLQEGLTRREFVQVNLALHEHLQQESGTAFDFFALLEDSAGSARLPAAALPFVQMARAAALRFGAGGGTPAHAGPARGDLKITPESGDVFGFESLANTRDTPPPPLRDRRPFSAYKYSAYISFAVDDDKSWNSWVSSFTDELNRALSARLRGIPVPKARLGGGVLPEGKLFDDQLRSDIDSSFAMIVFVHENYVASEWCLREVEYFRAMHDDGEFRERFYVIAMSEPAIRELSNREKWRRLFSSDDIVWLPFYRDDEVDFPVEIYAENPRGKRVVVSNEFWDRFLRLREDLATKIKASVDNDEPIVASTAPRRFAANDTDPVEQDMVHVYIESNQHESELWESIGAQLQTVWDEWMIRLEIVPPLVLRVGGLPMEHLEQFPLDLADGVVLLLGQKTQETLMSQIDAIERRLLDHNLAPAFIACLRPPQPVGPAPMSKLGWEVLRFNVVESAGVTIESDDKAGLEVFVRTVVERAGRRRDAAVQASATATRPGAVA